jgi:RimJ/RimL family protein N-acetyltransferase
MTVTLRADATTVAPALVLGPWADGDVQPLIEVCRDRAMRRWTSLSVTTAEEAEQWMAVQRHGWKTGKRLSFAVHEDPSGTGEGPLVAHVVLKRSGPPESAEVGYWTAAHARGRGVAPRAVEVVSGWAFDAFAAEGLERLELLHQVDNLASCRVAEKARYRFHRILPAQPPFAQDGHVHVRRPDGSPG